MSRKFFERNESFRCVACGADVAPHGSSCRDHCTECLHSLHVDINPGDRAHGCRGVMKPIGLDVRNGKKKIVYRCERCGEVHKNIVAEDDSRQVLLELAGKMW